MTRIAFTVLALSGALLALACATLALAIHVLLDDAPWQFRTPTVKAGTEAWPTGADGGDW